MNILVKVNNDDLPVKETYVKINNIPDMNSHIIEAMLSEVYAQVYGEEERYANGYWEKVSSVPHNNVFMTVEYNEAVVDGYASEAGIDEEDDDDEYWSSRYDA